MSRFDYVKYDESAQSLQGEAKLKCESLERMIGDDVRPGRAQSLALTALEECYMWIGKAIRDDQIRRTANTELQEERTNS